MCSVLHCFRHTTEMLLIIPAVTSKTSTTFQRPCTRTCLGSDSSVSFTGACLLSLRELPGSWRAAALWAVAFLVAPGSHEECRATPGSRRVVAQNNHCHHGRAPGPLPDSQRATIRRATPGLEVHSPTTSSIGSRCDATSNRSLACAQQLPSAPVPGSQRTHRSELLLCSGNMVSIRAAPWLAKHDGLQGRTQCEATGQLPGSLVVRGGLPVCFVAHSARRPSGLHPGLRYAVALWVALGLVCDVRQSSN